MFPTMERLPRRSRYSSATRKPAAASFLRPRADGAFVRLSGCPVASSSATRVSPRSTLTSTCLRIWWCGPSGSGDASLVGRRRAALRVDRLQQADGDESGQDRRASVGHQRERDTRDGHDPDVHPDVHEHLKHEYRDDSCREQGSIEVLGHREDPQTPPYEEGVEGDHERRTDEAPAL